MKLTPTTSKTRNGKPTARGFTLAEVLAALAFMAIVIPVTLQAMSIASRAGSVAQRKVIAARIAEKQLNELMVTGQWKTAGQKGSVDDGAITYNWQAKTAPWDRDSLQVVTMDVTFNVQGEEYRVSLNTLADNSLTAQ